jgi:CHAT domain-containing protein
MRPRLGLAWCIGTVITCVPAQAAGQAIDVDDQLQRAESHLKSGDYAAAYPAAAAGRDSTEIRHRAKAVQLLAKVCQRSGQFADALRYGEEYLKLVNRRDFAGIAAIDSDRQDTATLLGETYAALGRYSQADKRFEYALGIAGGNRLTNPAWEPETRLHWANALRAANANEQATKQYRQAADAAKRVLDAIQRRSLAERYFPAATEVFVEACLATGRTADAVAALEPLAQRQSSHERIETLLRIAEIRASGEPVSKWLSSAQAEELFDRRHASAAQGRLLERLAALYQREAARQADARQAQQLRKQATQSLQQAAACFQTLSNAHRDKGEPLPSDAENLQRWHEISVRMEDWDQALEAADRLLALRLRALLPRDPAIYRARRSLGVCYAKHNRFPEAIDQLKTALGFWESYRPAQPTERCDTLQNLAEVAREQGDYVAAEQYLRKALQLLNSDRAKAGAAGLARVERAVTPRIIKAHVNLGNVMSATARYSQAIAEYQTAESECGKYAGADDNGEFDTLRSLALLGRAAVYKTQVRFDKAIEDCRQALDLVSRVSPNSVANELSVLVTLASLHLSRYAWEGGSANSADLTEARSYIDRAGALCSGGAELALDERCQYLHVLALTSFRDAQSLCLQLNSELAAGEEGQAAKTRQIAAASCEKAMQGWRESRDLARGSRPAIEARSASYLAEVALLHSRLMDKRDAALAARMLDDAYDNASRAARLLAKLHAYPGTHYRALVCRAKILDQRRRRGRSDSQRAADTAQMETDLRDAVRLVEAPRSQSLGTEAQRAEFFSQFVEAYELLIDCLVERNQFEQAAAYSQISRNRTFVEEVSVSQQDIEKALEDAGQPQLLKLLRSAVELRDRLTEEVQQRANRTPAGQTAQRLGSDDPTTLSDRLASAQHRCDELIYKIRDFVPAFRNLIQGGLAIEDFQRARKRVVGGDGLLLVYHLGPQASQLFVITSDAVVCHALKVHEKPAAELGVVAGPLTNALALHLVRRYLSSDSLRPGGGDRVSRPLDAAGAVHLADIVLPQDVRAFIRQRQPAVTIVVPDGALHRLPLESLLIRQEPETYLLDDRDMPPFAYAPSVMVLEALSERASSTVPWPAEVLSVGNPRYAEAGLVQLDASAAECRTWAALFGPGGAANVRLLLDATATERNVRSSVAGRRLVHFAVHGLVNPERDNVLAAALALTPGAATSDGSPDAQDDGRLYLHEIYELNLNDCALAVLSACESNVGPERKLEAGSTLTRAFLSAGACRVVSSLWRVPDNSTAVLMEQFGRSIAESLERGDPPNYAAALQQARRHLRDSKEKANEKWRRPMNWAPFVLTGPPR